MDSVTKLLCEADQPTIQLFIISVAVVMGVI